MKLGLINSAWAQAGRDTAFGIRQTKAIGFDTIDIFADPLDIDALDSLETLDLVINEALLRMGQFVHARTGLNQLVLAGGVALNCVATGHLSAEGPFEQIWTQPAAGDA